MEADGCTGIDCRSTWELLPYKSQLAEILGSKIDLHAVATHNSH